MAPPTWWEKVRTRRWSRAARIAPSVRPGPLFDNMSVARCRAGGLQRGKAWNGILAKKGTTLQIRGCPARGAGPWPIGPQPRGGIPLTAVQGWDQRNSPCTSPEAAADPSISVAWWIVDFVGGAQVVLPAANRPIGPRTVAQEVEKHVPLDGRARARSHCRRTPRTGPGRAPQTKPTSVRRCGGTCRAAGSGLARGCFYPVWQLTSPGGAGGSCTRATDRTLRKFGNHFPREFHNQFFSVRSQFSPSVRGFYFQF